MNDFLSRIVAHKKAEVAASRLRKPEFRLRSAAERPRELRLFGAALSAGTIAADGLPRVRIIAEIKRASPSKGVIRTDLDPQNLAKAYAQGGAAALSVLTDARFFKGSLDDLRRARSAVSLPVLRKEFIISAYQLYETAAAGADAVLLIVRILSAQQLKEYMALSRELRLEPLVEVHSTDDLAVARNAGANIIGINNRNLQTFRTDIGQAQRLVAELQPGQIAVAASGIRRREDIEQNRRAGIGNFLIGESLVRAEDPVRMLRELAGSVNQGCRHELNHE